MVEAKIKIVDPTRLGVSFDLNLLQDDTTLLAQIQAWQQYPATLKACREACDQLLEKLVAREELQWLRRRDRFRVASAYVAVADIVLAMLLCEPLYPPGEVSSLGKIVLPLMGAVFIAAVIVALLFGRQVMDYTVSTMSLRCVHWRRVRPPEEFANVVDAIRRVVVFRERCRVDVPKTLQQEHHLKPLPLLPEAVRVMLGKLERFCPEPPVAPDVSKIKVVVRA